jgi:hypothetical protein
MDLPPNLTITVVEIEIMPSSADMAIPLMEVMPGSADDTAIPLITAEATSISSLIIVTSRSLQTTTISFSLAPIYQIGIGLSFGIRISIGIPMKAIQINRDGDGDLRLK